MKSKSSLFNIFHVLVFCLSITLSKAQTLSPFMINTAGGGAFAASTHYDFTIGEPLTHFGGSSCDSLFSGFQHCAIDTLRIKKFNINTSGTTTICAGSSVTLTSIPATSYTWNTGATSSAINATVSGVYSVTVTTACGNVVASKPVTITVISPPTPQICMVTTDSLGINNEIYWEKTLYPQADSFIVYREVSTNIYQRIGSVYKSSFSMYIDTNRSIGPNNGNPKLSSYKYKLQLIDTCNNYSGLSLWHQTIFVQDQQNGNFNWNSYAIESSASPVANYNLKRRNVITGAETLVGSTSSNLITDPNYAAFWPTQTKWLVDAVGFNCNPTTKINVLKTKTKSNQSNDRTFPTALYTQSLTDIIQTYPNPANGSLFVNLNDFNFKDASVKLYNMLGQQVYVGQINSSLFSIDISGLKSGIYMLKIEQNNSVVAIKRVIVN